MDARNEKNRIRLLLIISCILLIILQIIMTIGSIIGLYYLNYMILISLQDKLDVSGIYVLAAINFCYCFLCHIIILIVACANITQMAKHRKTKKEHIIFIKMVVIAGSIFFVSLILNVFIAPISCMLQTKKYIFSIGLFAAACNLINFIGMCFYLMVQGWIVGMVHLIATKLKEL